MQEFFHMGGYAPYVWSSYLLTLLVVLINLWQPWQAERHVRRQLERQERERASMAHENERS